MDLNKKSLRSRNFILFYLGDKKAKSSRFKTEQKIHAVSNRSDNSSFYPYRFLIRWTASFVASRSPKAVSLKNPSPFLPKPAPGVPTT